MKGPGEGTARKTIASTAGGVATEEVGAVTGDLEVATRPADEGAIEVAVRYAGANEWYAVEGSPVEPGGSAPQSWSGLRELITEHLTTPGPVVEGNEEPVSLEGFPLRAGGG